MLVAKKSLWCAVLALAPVMAAASPIEFKTSEPTNIPGLTLDPGSYSIQVIDHLSARYIVSIDGPGGQPHYRFLALENPAIRKPVKRGLVLWDHPSEGKRYVRGWLFPGTSSVLEFVYPKAEAVAIAKSNHAEVPAIDPASEGRPVELKGLSESDLRLINLWLLSSTNVGPGDTASGIKAERYPEVAGARK